MHWHWSLALDPCVLKFGNENICTCPALKQWIFRLCMMAFMCIQYRIGGENYLALPIWAMDFQTMWFYWTIKLKVDKNQSKSEFWVIFQVNAISFISACFIDRSSSDVPRACRFDQPTVSRVILLPVRLPSVWRQWQRHWNWSHVNSALWIWCAKTWNGRTRHWSGPCSWCHNGPRCTCAPLRAPVDRTQLCLQLYMSRVMPFDVVSACLGI